MQNVFALAYDCFIMGVFDSIKILVSKPVPAPSASTAPAKKILIVEDDELMRQFYVDLLQKEGFEMLQAKDGEEGFNTVVSDKPHLVLLDLMMPVMDGKAVLHKIRQLPEGKTLPVIILTNAGDEDSMRQTQVYDNANGFLIKANVSPEEIIQRVKSLI